MKFWKRMKPINKVLYIIGAGYCLIVTPLLKFVLLPGAFGKSEGLRVNPRSPSNIIR
jgi:hypothetical protein